MKLKAGLLPLAVVVALAAGCGSGSGSAGSLVKQPLETSLSPPPKEETTREMAAVTSLGVDHAQGFLLSRPLTAAQLQDYVADGAINLP